MPTILILASKSDSSANKKGASTRKHGRAYKNGTENAITNAKDRTGNLEFYCTLTD